MYMAMAVVLRCCAYVGLVASKEADTARFDDVFCLSPKTCALSPECKSGGQLPRSSGSNHGASGSSDVYLVTWQQRGATSSYMPRGCLRSISMVLQSRFQVS